MKQEDKELLLKDLCARLPYNIRVEYKGKTHSTIYDVLGVAHGRLAICLPFMSCTEHPLVEEVKPYLFPLSSMTEEQKKEQEAHFTCIKHDMSFSIYRYMEWCYKNHFDINGLIEKDLAIDATGLNIY